MKSYRTLALVACCLAVFASISAAVRADDAPAATVATPSAHATATTPAVVAAADAAASPPAPTSTSASNVASRLSHRVPSSAGAAGAADSADSSVEASSETTAQAAQQAMDQYIIDVVNALPDGSWTAGINEYFQDKSFEFLKKSCGLKMDLQQAVLGGVQQPLDLQPIPIPSPYAPVNPTPYTPQQQPNLFPPTAPVQQSDLPLFFDARRAWGAQCPSLFDIRDQAGCGSCWAVAAAEVMTDRHCIHSQGRNRPYLSATNILSCCGAQCGSCEGGMPLPAFQMWQSSGVVTGGDYGTSDTCQPYYLAPCAHHTKNSFLPECVAQSTTPGCSQSCTHGQNYQGDKHYGASAYALPSSVEAIQRELLQNGPIEVGFMVYADFPHYKSGVYSHVQGDMVGGHAVKLMGWGVENGIDYWLCANSWNTNWGDAGFFKIRRGTNEGNIETMAWAGMPRVM